MRTRLWMSLVVSNMLGRTRPTAGQSPSGSAGDRRAAQRPVGLGGGLRNARPDQRRVPSKTRRATRGPENQGCNRRRYMAIRAALAAVTVGWLATSAPTAATVEIAIEAARNTTEYRAIANTAQSAAEAEGTLALDRPSRRLIQQGLRNEGFDPCSRPRGNAEFWTRVDRKMLWWPGHRQTDRFRVCSPASRRVAALRPRFRGAHGLDAGSAHAVQTCPCLTMPHSRPPRCCGRPSVQIDAVSDDR